MSRKCSVLLLLLCVGLSEVVAQNCVLTVPANPLTAAGLATPWLQTGCVQTPMALGGTASFVQATIIDLDTGNMFTYTPLILSAAAPNNVAAIAPTVPALPANSVVGLFGGTNGGSTTLQATLTTDPATANTQDSSLIQGNCENGGGTPYSIFGQFFCCNCRQFMDAVYNAIRAGLVTSGPQTGYAANQIPILGVDHDNLPCPTTHSFSIVDQDQSDNAPAKYLFVNKTGQLAQSTVANKAKLTAAKTTFIEFDNGSDEDLVTLVQQGIGCIPWTLTDLADTTGATKFASSLSNEVQALTREAMPRAFVPAMDPMVLNNGNPDINKLNAYRATIGQAPLESVGEASAQIYCNNLYAVGAPAIARWLPMLLNVPAPDFGIGVSNTLAGVLVGRFSVTVNAPANGGMLNCPGLLGLPNPFAKFTGVGAGGALVCPAPNFNPKTCAFMATNGVTTIAQALGVSKLVPDMTGQTTFDIPLAPASPITGVLL